MTRVTAVPLPAAASERDAAPVPPLRTRLVRTAMVAAVWGVTALPIVLGFSRCALAAVFHHPCPGCGMTRAMRLLLKGEVAASLAMHPFALLALSANLMLVLVTIGVTFVEGTPFFFWRRRIGKATLGLFALSFFLVLGLWIAREMGMYGGPVPVT
jgi:hypothetical protein